MASKTNNNDDGLLLLELGIDIEQNDFDRARQQLKLLQGSLTDLTSNIGLGSLLDGLRTAASLLRGLIQSWNSLEDKAINVVYNTQDYLPYNLTPGERQNISNRISSSKLADQFGITPDTILNDLSNIISEQRKTTQAGKVNDENWTAVYQLSNYMGDSRFMASNLSDMLTFNPATVVYSGLTDMLANAYRKAYSLPENSSQREQILQLIKGVEESPYISPNVGHFESLMTEPNVPIYGQMGDPMSRLLSAGIEDEGAYMERLQKKSGTATSVSSDLDYLRSENSEAWDQLALSLYNFFGKNVAIPLNKLNKEVTDLFTGKSMSSIWSQGLNGRLLLGATGLEFLGAGEDINWSAIVSAQKRKALDRTSNLDVGVLGGADLSALQYRFGVSSNWVEGVTPVDEKVAQILSHSSKNSAITNELAYYELARLGQSTYGTDVSLLLDYAVGQIANQEEFKFGRKHQYKTPQEARAAIINELMNPFSKYYIGAEGGFASVYSMLYATGSFASNSKDNEKEFLQTMAKVFENTKMSELRNFYGDTVVPLDQDITSANVKNTGSMFSPDWRLELTIKDEKTGETRKEIYTADQLFNGMKATY